MAVFIYFFYREEGFFEVFARALFLRAFFLAICIKRHRLFGTYVLIEGVFQERARLSPLLMESVAVVHHLVNVGHLSRLDAKLLLIKPWYIELSRFFKDAAACAVYFHANRLWLRLSVRIL